MSKKRKLFNSILFSALLLGAFVSTPVFAAEKVYSQDTNNSSETIEYMNEELSPAMAEICESLLSDEELQEGDIRVLDIRDGEEFCVEVTDVTESSYVTYAATTTTSKTFTFYIKNIVGTKTNLFKVISTCTWIKGSKITNLNCAYTTLASGVSCSWNDNYKMATDVHHTLALDITYSGKSYFVIFGAILNVDRTTLNLTCSEDYEL